MSVLRGMPVEYRLLLDADPDGGFSAGLQVVTDDGQWQLVGAEIFGPFDDRRDVITWVWSRLSVDLCGSLP